MAASLGYSARNAHCNLGRVWALKCICQTLLTEEENHKSSKSSPAATRVNSRTTIYTCCVLVLRPFPVHNATC